MYILLELITKNKKYMLKDRVETYSVFFFRVFYIHVYRINIKGVFYTMKKFKKLLRKITIKKHCLVMDEKYVTEVLNEINSAYVCYINQNLVVDKYDLQDQPFKWYIYFTASQDQWSKIVKKLNCGFRLLVKDGTGDIYIEKKEWP